MEVHIENVTNLVSSSMQWMPSPPLIEFDQTKRMGHRPWSTDDAYSTHLLVRFKMLHQRGGRSVGRGRHGCPPWREIVPTIKVSSKYSWKVVLRVPSTSRLCVEPRGTGTFDTNRFVWPAVSILCSGKADSPPDTPLRKWSDDDQDLL